MTWATHKIEQATHMYPWKKERFVRCLVKIKRQRKVKGTSGILGFSTWHRNRGISVNTEDMQQKGGWPKAFQAHQLQRRIYAISRKSQTKKSQHQGPRTLMCSFKALGRKPWEEDLGWHMGKPRCMFIFPTKAIKNPGKPCIIFVTLGPSPWDPELVVREKWFGQ